MVLFRILTFFNFLVFSRVRPFATRWWVVAITTVFLLVFFHQDNIKELLEKAENPLKSRQQLISIFMENQENPKSLAGIWEGQYIDVRGYRGNLELRLEQKGDEVEGSFHLTVADEDRPQVFTGRIEGITKPGSKKLQARVIPFNKQQETEPISLDFHLSHAGSYAEQAIFASIAENFHPDLGGGVWIAWKFNKDSLH